MADQRQLKATINSNICHLFRSFFACLLFCCTYLSAQAVSAQSSDKRQSIPPLAAQTWGTVLYEFYQENYQQGLVQLAIAENKGLGEHQAQALVAKGGMSLVHGMVGQAEDIFTRLADSQDPDVQAQAWFWLSKSFFDSGRWLKTQQALQKTQAFDDLYNSSERELLAYMRVQMLVLDMDQETDDSVFMAALDKLPANSVYRPYLNYNLGLNQLNQKLLPEALVTFERAKAQISQAATDNWRQSWWGSWANNLWTGPLSKMTQVEREGFSDRLHLAMGYASLGMRSPRQALTQFANIRQHQQASANALLGYAQALASQDELPMALAIWQKVSEDFPASISALQSLLAMAWQLEQAGDEQQAWQKLQVSLEQLALAEKDVNNTLSWLKQDDFLDTMVTKDAFGNESMQVQTWPQSQSDILQSLLAGQPRQQLNSWLELAQQQKSLEQKQTDLVGFKRLLDERKQTAVIRGEQLAQADFIEQIADSEKRLASLSQLLEQAQQQQDASVLANEEQLAQLARIKKSQQRLQRILKGKTLSPKYAQRLKRIEGILKWNFADNYQPLIWQHQQALKQTQHYLDQAKTSKDNLLTRISSPPQYPAEYQKITDMQTRIKAFQSTIDELKLGIAVEVTRKAKQALYQRVRHLKQFEQNIKLAMLRLQDKDRNQLQAATLDEVSAYAE